MVRRRCRRRRRRTLRRTSKNHYGVWVMWVRRLISAWGLIISFFDVTENLFPANTVFEERVRARAVSERARGAMSLLCTRLNGKNSNIRTKKYLLRTGGQTRGSTRCGSLRVREPIS